MLSWELEGQRVYYYFYSGDLLGVNPEGNVTLWQKSVNVPIKDDNAKPGDARRPYELSRIEVSCVREKYRSLESHAYDARGTAILGKSVTEPGEWATVIPNTLPHWWFVAGCNSQAKKDFDGEKAWREVVEFFSERKK